MPSPHLSSRRLPSSTVLIPLGVVVAALAVALLVILGSSSGSTGDAQAASPGVDSVSQRADSIPPATDPGLADTTPSDTTPSDTTPPDSTPAEADTSLPTETGAETPPPDSGDVATITADLTWPARGETATYTVDVPIEPGRSVDYYGSSVSMGAGFSLSPGFEQTFECPAGESQAAVEFYEGPGDTVTMELTVTNGGCTPVPGQTGAVPVEADITVRYDNGSSTTVAGGNLPLDPADTAAI